MRLGVDFNILNQKGTPAFYSDIFANRPAAGFAGRVFISTDTGAIYEDTGSAWTLIADAGAGTTGTLQQVTTNGNTTSAGISVTAGGIGTNSLIVQGSRASFYNGTAAQLGMTLQNGSVPGTLTRGDLWLYSATSVNNNLVLANDLYSSQFILPTSNQVFTFPAATGTIGLSSSALTAGSVVFAGSSGVLSESNATFFWDNTNKRLGIGNATPGAPLDVHGTGTAAQFNGTGTNNAYLQFQNAGTSKWRIGNTYSAGANTFDLYNNGAASTALSFNSTTNNATFNGGLRTTGTADQQLWVYGGSPSLRLYDNATTPTVNGFVGMATAANNFILGSASGDMCIGTSTAGKIYIGSGSTTVSPAMTILSTGQIFAGSTTQFDSLTRFSFTYGGGSSNYLDIVNSSNSDSVIRLIGGTGSYGQIINKVGNLYISTDTNMIFRTNPNVEAMRITSTQNVLIGTTTDNGQKLQVSGTAQATGFQSISGTISIASGATGTIHTMTVNALYQVNVFVNGGTTIYNAASIFISNASAGQYVNALGIYDGANVTLSNSGSSITIKNDGFATFTWNYSILIQTY